jgi:uncharacterized protein (TIGR02569 family)
VTGPPPPEVLAAFGVTGTPRRLAGGMGRTWVADGVVLKPVDHDPEHVWVCEVYDAWSSDEVAVPQPLRAGGAWSASGWGAHVFVPGTTALAGEDLGWFRGVHDAFHDAVAGLPRPGFLDARRDAWSYGDRLAWEGLAPMGEARTVALIERALGLLRPVDLSSQVVHGDLAGNVLRDGDRAAVIDWPPYWRPRAWALAVVATDAICWEGADPALLDDWAEGTYWLQLVLRAAVFRMGTRAFNEAHGLAAVDEDEFVAGKVRLLEAVEARL